MFGKLASDALGLTDLCKVLVGDEIKSADAQAYILKEEGEKIYFVLKSKSDEYCFTNFALIHVDGKSAVSSKRLIKRYSFKTNSLEKVKFETAGTVDLDSELKFNLDKTEFSIDVNREQTADLILLYKALISLSGVQKSNKLMWDSIKDSFEVAKHACGRGNSANTLSEDFKYILSTSMTTYKSSINKYFQKDYSDVFDKYIK